MLTPRSIVLFFSNIKLDKKHPTFQVPNQTPLKKFILLSPISTGEQASTQWSICHRSRIHEAILLRILYITEWMLVWLMLTAFGWKTSKLIKFFWHSCSLTDRLSVFCHPRFCWFSSQPIRDYFHHASEGWKCTSPFEKYLSVKSLYFSFFCTCESSNLGDNFAKQSDIPFRSTANQKVYPWSLYSICWAKRLLLPKSQQFFIHPRQIRLRLRDSSFSGVLPFRRLICKFFSSLFSVIPRFANRRRI